MRWQMKRDSQARRFEFVGTELKLTGYIVKCNFDYIENLNFLLDLQIMVRTFINRKGAC